MYNSNKEETGKVKENLSEAKCDKVKEPKFQETGEACSKAERSSHATLTFSPTKRKSKLTSEDEIKRKRSSDCVHKKKDDEKTSDASNVDVLTTLRVVRPEPSCAKELSIIPQEKEKITVERDMTGNRENISPKEKISDTDSVAQANKVTIEGEKLSDTHIKSRSDLIKKLPENTLLISAGDRTFISDNVKAEVTANKNKISRETVSGETMVSKTIASGASNKDNAEKCKYLPAKERLMDENESFNFEEIKHVNSPVKNKSEINIEDQKCKRSTDNIQEWNIKNSTDNPGKQDAVLADEHSGKHEKHTKSTPILPDYTEGETIDVSDSREEMFYIIKEILDTLSQTDSSKRVIQTSPYKKCSTKPYLFKENPSKSNDKLLLGNVNTCSVTGETDIMVNVKQQTVGQNVFSDKSLSENKIFDSRSTHKSTENANKCEVLEELSDNSEKVDKKSSTSPSKFSKTEIKLSSDVPKVMESCDPSEALRKQQDTTTTSPILERKCQQRSIPSSSEEYQSETPEYKLRSICVEQESKYVPVELDAEEMEIQGILLETFSQKRHSAWEEPYAVDIESAKQCVKDFVTDEQFLSAQNAFFEHINQIENESRNDIGMQQRELSAINKNVPSFEIDYEVCRMLAAAQFLNRETCEGFLQKTFQSYNEENSESPPSYDNPISPATSPVPNSPESPPPYDNILSPLASPVPESPECPPPYDNLLSPPASPEAESPQTDKTTAIDYLTLSAYQESAKLQTKLKMREPVDLTKLTVALETGAKAQERSFRETYESDDNENLYFLRRTENAMSPPLSPETKNSETDKIAKIDVEEETLEQYQGLVEQPAKVKKDARYQKKFYKNKRAPKPTIWKTELSSFESDPNTALSEEKEACETSQLMLKKDDSVENPDLAPLMDNSKLLSAPPTENPKIDSATSEEFSELAEHIAKVKKDPRYQKIFDQLKATEAEKERQSAKNTMPVISADEYKKCIFMKNLYFPPQINKSNTEKKNQTKSSSKLDNTSEFEKLIPRFIPGVGKIFSLNPGSLLKSGLHQHENNLPPVLEKENQRSDVTTVSEESLSGALEYKSCSELKYVSLKEKQKEAELVENREPLLESYFHKHASCDVTHTVNIPDERQDSVEHVKEEYSLAPKTETPLPIDFGEGTDTETQPQEMSANILNLHSASSLKPCSQSDTEVCENEYELVDNLVEKTQEN